MPEREVCMMKVYQMPSIEYIAMPELLTLRGSAEGDVMDIDFDELQWL